MDDQPQRTDSRSTDDASALREGAEIYRFLLDESSDPIFAFNPDGTYRYVNKAFADGVGRNQEEIIGANIRDVFPQEEAEKRFAVVKWVFEKAVTKVIEVRVPRPDGDRYFITTAKPIADESGKVTSVICTSKEITDRKRAEDTLRESEERYRTFVKNFQGIAYRGDIKWTADFFHGKVESITGYPEETLVGRNPRWDQIIHPDDLKTLEGKDELASVPGFSVEREYRIIRKDGEIRWLYETAQNVCDDSGSIQYIQGTILDISGRKKAQEELEAKNEMLLKLHRMKDTLLRDVAHELKTPVAKHSMQVEILKSLRGEERLSEAEKKTFLVMEESIHRQESVIRNLLDMSRLETGGRTYRKEEVALDTFFSRLRNDYIYAVDSQNVVLDMDVPAIRLPSDEEMLWHLFSNLLNNAIKFRRKGVPLRVNVSAESSGAEVIVRITDNGTGIAPEETERVFSRFYQASPSTEGSGIGLAICRRIAKDLGGGISIAPNVGTAGITVNVSLPLESSS